MKPALACSADKCVAGYMGKGAVTIGSNKVNVTKTFGIYMYKRAKNKP